MVAPLLSFSHFGFFVRDIERQGNRIELFVDTPWYVEQPVRIPMDMALADVACPDAQAPPIISAPVQGRSP